MTSTEPTAIVGENRSYPLEAYDLDIDAYLGQRGDVYYFQVTARARATPLSTEEAAPRENKGARKFPTFPEIEPIAGRALPARGLLRVGNAEGGLRRELQLRARLGEHQMLAPLLAATVTAAVAVDLPEPAAVSFESSSPQPIEPLSPSELALAEELRQLEPLSDALEPDEIDDEPTGRLSDFDDDDEPTGNLSSPSSEKLLLLSELPPAEATLADWLDQSDRESEQALLYASQLCQFYRHLASYQWCAIALDPEFVSPGPLLKVYDLTRAYPCQRGVAATDAGPFAAPEVSFGRRVEEAMSTYVVGAFLYRALYDRDPIPATIEAELEAMKIPRLYQILKIALSSLPDDRFPLGQLLDLIIETRQELRVPEVRWETASTSTLGLSVHRLQNEDSCAAIAPTLSYLDAIALGIVADGMGGMSQGDVASRTAVESIVSTPFPERLHSPQERQAWLTELMQRANAAVSETVRNGGTTLSLVLAVGRELAIAHVGDSRIFLVRKGTICQLSEDHSLVAMLLASGEISYEESLDHPERSVLTKSLGLKPRLSEGYVQDLYYFGYDYQLSLEDGDTLLLCSDGVWDVLPASRLAELIAGPASLQAAVDGAIAEVLALGARDNATLVALRCSIRERQF